MEEILHHLRYIDKTLYYVQVMVDSPYQMVQDSFHQ